MSNFMNRAILIIVALFALSGTVLASGTGDFPSCLNPQGTLKVSYGEGTHGIPGDRSTYQGSDAVYQLDGNAKVLQCFCADTGRGVQTNWWKANTLSDKEVENMTRNGWVDIPNGLLWGLDNTRYIARNSTYTCGGLAIGGGEWTGLAGTGTIANIYGIASLGLASFVVGAIKLISKRA